MAADETTEQRGDPAPGAAGAEGAAGAAGAAGAPGAERAAGAPGDPAAGLIDAGARILGQLLRSPRLVQSVRVALRHLDPEAAPRLVRAAMRGDPVLFLELVSATPALANAGILGLREAVTQLGELPAELTDRLLPRLLGELRAEELGELAALTLGYAHQRLGGERPALSRAWAELEQGFARGWRRALQRRGAPGAGTREAPAGAAGAAGAGGAAADEAPLSGPAVSGALTVTRWLADRLEARLADGGGLEAQARRLADGIRALSHSHPQTMERLVRPLAAACRQALEE
jgi:hypothetical protein